MVFSSIPGYLDPSNWQQQHQQHHLQQNHQSGLQHGINISSINPSSLTNPNPLLPPPPLPPPQQPRAQLPPHTGPMSASGSLIRPGSMAERARMANIPMPEVALKCPRCESTNTKFCYFNNYSLSQPRHFCKTCRRYWTRGGALRSVPVGGGCRRNKRSKSNSSNSKSSATSGGDRERSSSAAAATSSASSAGGSVSHSHSSMAEMMGLTSPPSQLLSSLRFMTPLHHLTDLGDQLGLSSYGAGDSGFHLGGIGSGGAEQWRIPNPPGPTQFPFLGGMDIGSSLYGHHPFEGVEFSNLAIGGSGGALRASKAEEAPAAEMVKVEERGNEEMRLVRGFNMGMNNNNNNNVNHQENGEEQYNNWGGNGSNSSGNGWTDLSALNNSSCSTTSAL